MYTPSIEPLERDPVTPTLTMPLLVALAPAPTRMPVDLPAPLEFPVARLRMPALENVLFDWTSTTLEPNSPLVIRAAPPTAVRKKLPLMTPLFVPELPVVRISAEPSPV